MERKERLENIEKFRKIFGTEVKNINQEEFEKYFYMENFFLERDYLFIEKNFYETILDIITNLLKNFIGELEYYVTIKPVTPLTNSDMEVLAKENKKLMKYYFNIHKYYKQSHKIVLSHNANSKNVIDFLENIFETLKDLNNYFEKLQDKLIENLIEKIKDLDKKNKPHYESSIFH